MSALAGVGALVFDMDGVLLDTSRSFTRGVLLSAAACAPPPGLQGDWTEAQVERLRICGGFNNDWDAATALALLGAGTDPGPGWDAVCVEVECRGAGVPAAQEMTGQAKWEEARSAVVPIFQALYAGPKSMEVYGVEPTCEHGLYEDEIPLVTADEIETAGLPFGIFTGRTRGEVALGLDRLGFDVPVDRLVCDTERRFRKPLPDGLLALANALGGGTLLHVGDGVDDQLAAANARLAGLDVRFAGVAPPGSEREERFLAKGAAVVRPSLREVLEELRRSR